MAFCQQFKDQIHALWTLPHKQPGGCYLTVNGIAADQVKRDSMWCLYDTLVLRGWSERPADSIEWDLGDGTRLSLHDVRRRQLHHRRVQPQHREAKGACGQGGARRACGNRLQSLVLLQD